MREIHSDEARRRFRPLLDDVEHHGERVKILRYDRPAAIMVPPDWYERAEAALGEAPDGS
jgi:PHD/YefM family antitoxin component YafN of YafNO toxin-antitoxin module